MEILWKFLNAGHLVHLRPSLATGHLDTATQRYVSCQEPQMAAVLITFVKTLQTKLQETYYTILKYRNEIIFVPSFVFIGLCLRPRCFHKGA